MSPDDRDNLMLRMSEDLGAIKKGLSSMESLILGNGHPGLIQACEDMRREQQKMEKRITIIETVNSTEVKKWGLILTALAFLINAGIGIGAWFHK